MSVAEFLTRYGHTFEDAMKCGTLSEEEIQRLFTYKQLTTEEEINSLPDRANVIIWWTGGNGPHHYTVSKSRSGIVYAAGCAVDFVGERKPRTLVWSV